MAETVWYVSYDIQEAASSGAGGIKFEKQGSKSEASFPPLVAETNAINSEGGEGLKGPVSVSKNVEVTASTAAEAAEVVRSFFPQGQSSGKVRVLNKPNTNFKVIA